jgi:hypothetical protein
MVLTALSLLVLLQCVHEIWTETPSLHSRFVTCDSYLNRRICLSEGVWQPWPPLQFLVSTHSPAVHSGNEYDLSTVPTIGRWRSVHLQSRAPDATRWSAISRLLEGFAMLTGIECANGSSVRFIWVQVFANRCSSSRKNLPKGATGPRRCHSVVTPWAVNWAPTVRATPTLQMPSLRCSTGLTETTLVRIPFAEPNVFISNFLRGRLARGSRNSRENGHLSPLCRFSRERHHRRPQGM